MSKLILGQVYYHSEIQNNVELVTIFRPYLYVERVDEYLILNNLYTETKPWPYVAGYIYEMIREDDRCNDWLDPTIGACTIDSRLANESLLYDRYDIEQDIKDVFNGG